MIDRLLKGAAGLTLLFILGIGGTRLSPQTEPDLDAFQQLFQSSPGCEVHCLLGIRAGMPLREALDILRANDWVNGVTNPNTFVAQTDVYWQWSGRQPEWIDDQVMGVMSARSETDDMGHYITGITLTTHLRLYDLERGLGQTPNGSAFYLLRQDRIAYSATYYDPRIKVRTTLSALFPCPARLLDYYWRDQTQITQNEGPTLQEYIPPQAMPGLCRSAHQGA
ncbi:MAG: hypothetical protein K8J31_29700 [Anaerolineae bacterium]|nr:hypothetical protein [Anaerolineae bacterium]